MDKQKYEKTISYPIINYFIQKMQGISKQINNFWFNYSIKKRIVEKFKRL